MSTLSKPTERIDFTVQPVTSKDDIAGYTAIEHSAFEDWPTMEVMYPSHLAISEEKSLSCATEIHMETWLNDSTAIYCTAKLPSGQIIGGAKWNFFQNSGPQFPWPNKYAPDANVEMIEWYFGQLDEKRNKDMIGKKHVLMATLVVSPEYQRCGIGARLLEWGLKRCDEEELECWIDATDKGKGLYLKYGWEEVGGLDVHLERWGGAKGVVIRSANLIRQPQTVSSK
jgi:GNAT superfamily N-acetyltransferase